MMRALRLLVLMTVLLSPSGPALASRPIAAELDPLPADVRKAVASRLAGCGGDEVMSIQSWVAAVPDLNGDGVGDWVVESPFCRRDLWPWHRVEAYVSVPGGHFREALLPDGVNDYRVNARERRARLVSIDRRTCPPDGGICTVYLDRGACGPEETNCAEDVLVWDRAGFRFVHSAGYRPLVPGEG